MRMAGLCGQSSSRFRGTCGWKGPAEIEASFGERRTSPRSDVARENRNYGDFQRTSGRPCQFAQAQFGRRPPGRPHRPRGKDKAVYCYPLAHYDYWKRELPGRELPTASLRRKLYHRGLAGRFSPHWRPVLHRFRRSDRDPAPAPLLQTGRKISVRRHGEAIPGKRADRVSTSPLPAREKSAPGMRSERSLEIPKPSQFRKSFDCTSRKDSVMVT